MNVKAKPTDAPEKETILDKAPDYRAQYEAAKKSGTLNRPTYRIHNWSEDSAALIGKVTNIEEFKGGTFDAVVNAYRLETDDGNVSCILGSYTDKQLEGLDLIGKIIAIIWKGKKELDDERKVNIFDVDILSV